MIPKKIHAVWFGASTPVTVLNRLAEWRKLHPDFEVKLWTERDSPVHLPYLRRAIRLHNWANASNLMRLWILLREGGIYLDTDVDVVRRFDPLLCDECFVGIESKPDIEPIVVNNAVLGSVPGHPFIEECLSMLLTEFDGSESADLSSPILTTRILRSHGLVRYGAQRLWDGRVRVYDRVTFYPYGYSEQPLTAQADLPAETIAVHRWHKSWQTPVPSFLERAATRLLTAVLYGADKFASGNPTTKRMLSSARRRAALRRLRTSMEIQSGLFAGLRFASGTTTGSSLLPKLLGTYEFSVQRILGGWAARDYRVIYNVGCECGMLLAGLAALFPGARLFGFDVNEEACRVAKSNLSDAAERTRILPREFRWDDLVEVQGRSLMICDIEGAERPLFSQHSGRLPDDIIIELHDFKDPTLPESLCSLLEPTHRLRLIGEDTPSLRALDRIDFVALAEAASLSNEGRPIPMHWLIAETVCAPEIN